MSTIGIVTSNQTTARGTNAQTFLPANLSNTMGQTISCPTCFTQPGNIATFLPQNAMQLNVVPMQRNVAVDAQGQHYILQNNPSAAINSNVFAIPGTVMSGINTLQSGDIFTGVTGVNTLQPVEPVFEPATFVSDEAAETVIKVELSGVSEKNTHVALRNDTIIISGNKDQTMSTATGNTFCVGATWCGRFYRGVSLGYTPEQKQVSATFANGILTICVKKPQSHKSESIRITSSAS